MSVAETAELAVRLTLDDKMSGAINKAQGKLKGLGSTAKTVGKGIAIGLGAGAVVGIGLLTNAIHDGITALKEDKVVAAQTAAVIKSTGGAAGVSAQQVQDLADKLSVLDGVQDNVVGGAENLLLTFTNIGANIFPDATAAVLDMAAALGTDANSAAKTLGKALQDPIKGMTALRRVGVILSDSQQEQIKHLIKIGDLYGAQRIILGEVAKKYHGVAQAQADADPGKRLAVNVERFQKALATGLLPVIEKVQSRISDWLGKPETLNTIRKVGDAIASIFTDDNLDAAAGAIETAANAVGVAIKAFNSLPPEIKALAIGAFAINKVTGGAVGGVAGALGKVLGAGLSKIFAANVTVIGGNVTSPGGAGNLIEGAAGAAGGISLASVAAASVVALTAAGFFVGLYASMTAGEHDTVTPGKTPEHGGQIFHPGHGFGPESGHGQRGDATTTAFGAIGQHLANVFRNGTQAIVNATVRNPALDKVSNQITRTEKQLHAAQRAHDAADTARLQSRLDRLIHKRTNIRIDNVLSNYISVRDTTSASTFHNRVARRTTLGIQEMALTFGYSDPGGFDGPTVQTDLGTEVVRFGKLNLIQSAAVGEPAVCGIEFDDPNGTLDFVGLRAFSAYEHSAPSNNIIVWAGVMQDRRVMRADSMRTGAARRWSVDLVDYNWMLGARVLVDADSKRPAETAGDRIRWLLASAAHINFYDFGHVVYPTHHMDPCDYRGQRANDVLADCCIEGGYTFWSERNEATQKPELFFIDPNGTDYPSTSRISNDYADYDGAVTFLPYEDAVLTRSPGRIAYGVYLPYANGSVYVRDDAIGEQFARQDQTAPMSNVKSAARARRIANKFQNDNDEETDTVTCSVKVPAANVNDIRAGHVLDCKFTHLPGYESFRPMRVTRRAVIQDEEGGGHVGSSNSGAYYRIELEMTPTGGSSAISCSTALADAVAAFEESTGSGTAHLSITPTAGEDSLIMIGFAARNDQVPSATAAHLTGSATEIYATNIDGVTAHPAFAIGYQAVAAASGATALTATYTPGFGGLASEGFVAAAIRTSSTSPLQEKHDIFASTANGHLTFASPPTPGNMIVMAVVVRDDDPYTTDLLYPNTGWTAVVTTGAYLDGIGLYARCVQTGDGSTYGVGNSQSNAHAIVLTEIAL